jgi:putative ABC transport system permease protein
MLKNYITVAFRSLLRNKWYTTINVIGLSLGIACVIVAFVIYTDAAHFDAFHKNYNSIYRVIGVRTINDKDVRVGIVPLPLGSRLLQDCPQVERAVRVDRLEGYVRKNDKVFSERIEFADSGFFEMFTFPLMAGTADLTKANQILISEEYAKKYFGDENPIGEILSVTMPNSNPINMIVSGVLKPYPYNSSLKFDILASSKVLVDIGWDEPANWGHITWALFIQVPDPASLPAVRDKLNEYLPIQAAANPNGVLKQLSLDPLKDVAIKSQSTRSNSLQRFINDSAVYGIGLWAILILLMGCFNYINTALAYSHQRLKEIGVRKVMGSSKSNLVIQFLIEHFVVCVVALILGLCLAELLAPGLNNLFPFMDLRVNPIQSTSLLLFLVVIIISTAIGAGSYPAYVISSFNPVGIFRSRFKTGKTSAATKVFLCFQLSLSMAAVTGAIVFAQNSEFNKNLDLGYETHNVINVGVENAQRFTVLKNEIQNHPGINVISGSQTPIRISNVPTVVQYASERREANIFTVGFDYIEALKLRLKEGRSFNWKTPTDTSNCVVINATLAKELGWTSSADQTVTIHDKSYQVIGVVEDFFNYGTFRQITPCVFRACGPDQYSVMNILVQPGQSETVINFLRTTWSRLFPDIPISANTQDFFDAEAIQVSENISIFHAVLAMMAILIASMGIFALVSLNMVRRAKEVGIRKVLGASISQIMLLTNREMIILLVLASIVADIGGSFFIRLLMDSVWKYHIGISGIVKLTGNLIIVFGVILTAGWQIWKTAHANPIESLKYE